MCGLELSLDEVQDAGPRPTRLHRWRCRFSLSTPGVSEQQCKVRCAIHTDRENQGCDDCKLAATSARHKIFHLLLDLGNIYRSKAGFLQLAIQFY